MIQLKIQGLEIGQVIRGWVKAIKPYGAFIDLGGVCGWSHISEICHENIDSPHCIFEVNDEVEVIIVDLDTERGRIS